MRVLHLADLHLGYKQYGLLERYNDYFETFNRVLQLSKPDCVMISGDLFHARETLAADILRAFKILQPFRTVAIPGTHDSSEVFKILQLLGIKLPPCEIDGVFFGTILDTPPSGKFSILMLHGMLDEYSPHPSATDFRLSDLKALGYNYIALGHFHDYFSISLPENGGLFVVNPGSIEMFRISEKTPKRYIILDTEKKLFEAIELQTRRWYDVKFKDLEKLDYSDRPIVRVTVESYVELAEIASYRERCLALDVISHLPEQPPMRTTIGSLTNFIADNMQPETAELLTTLLKGFQEGRSIKEQIKCLLEDCRLALS